MGRSTANTVFLIGLCLFIFTIEINELLDLYALLTILWDALHLLFVLSFFSVTQAQSLSGMFPVVISDAY